MCLLHFFLISCNQRSLASYIKKHAYSNAKTEDLWAALEEGTGEPVKKLMNTWTKQQGYPVVSAKVKDHELEFEQVIFSLISLFLILVHSSYIILEFSETNTNRVWKRYVLQSQFLSSGSQGSGQWIVPITLCCGSYDVRKSFLLETKSKTFDMNESLGCSISKNSLVETGAEAKDERNSATCSWIKLNVDQSGFYRVKYDENLAAMLRHAIEKKYLSATDRYGNFSFLVFLHILFKLLIN